MKEYNDDERKSVYRFRIHMFSMTHFRDSVIGAGHRRFSSGVRYKRQTVKRKSTSNLLWVCTSSYPGRTVEMFSV